MPLDALLLKAKAGSDDFISEKYVDQVSAIMEKWSSGLLESPQKFVAFENVLLPSFSATSLKPVQSSNHPERSAD